MFLSIWLGFTSDLNGLNHILMIITLVYAIETFAVETCHCQEVDVCFSFNNLNNLEFSFFVRKENLLQNFECAK